MEWYFILLIVLSGLLIWLLLSVLLYRHFFKRLYDIILSGTAIIVLLPLLLCMIIIGTIVMRGNPFFIQRRPGKKEKIFNLIKFRSMSNLNDEDGNLLSDEKRLTKYGKFIRKTSLDELPELFNIFIGNMSFIGPRPLLIEYLPLYSEKQHHRHDVLPGLTGYAQCHGRNSLTWTERFEMDVYYANNVTLLNDIRIFFKTILCVLKRDGINSDTSVTMEDFTGDN